MIYRFVWCLCQIGFGLFLRRRVIGRENVPKTGGVILASNHISNVDPPHVGTCFWRPCAFMAKEELFQHPLFGWFITKLNAFPVKRGTADRASLKKSLELLEQGWALLIFPEGTRSETGELQPPEMGVGMIAYRSGVPVVPAYAWGTDKVMPKGGGVKLAQIGVRYGKPLQFSTPEGTKAGREEYEAAAHAIMAAIAALRDEHLLESRR
jgi:1-acyl-sn-glycerol-3-phosphate acyltransferase